jgi:hypothetical protein
LEQKSTESLTYRLGEAMKPNNTYGTKKICILIFSLMIFTAIMVFFTGENIVERLASGSRLIST